MLFIYLAVWKFRYLFCSLLFSKKQSDTFFCISGDWSPQVIMFLSIATSSRAIHLRIPSASISQITKQDIQIHPYILDIYWAGFLSQEPSPRSCSGSFPSKVAYFRVPLALTIQQTRSSSDLLFMTIFLLSFRPLTTTFNTWRSHRSFIFSDKMALLSSGRLAPVLSYSCPFRSIPRPWTYFFPEPSPKRLWPGPSFPVFVLGVVYRIFKKLQG